MRPAAHWRTPLPMTAWPAAYREPFEHARQVSARFRMGHRRRRWRERTWKMVESACGHWLRYLQHFGLFDPAAAPEALITPERVEHYRAALEAHCLDATIVMRIDGLAETAVILAPAADWSWLRQGAAQLRADIRRVKPKLPRLQPIRTLLALGVELMAEADTLGWSARRAAVRYRDGLMIALLAARPLHCANFAGLRLESSLVRLEDRWWIRLAGPDTKTGRRIEMPLPEAFTEPMDLYLERHRPLLLGARQDDHLWLKVDGSAVRPHVVFKQISVLTEERLGVAVNPHSFRHAATTSIALDDPHRIDIAADVLGHGRGTSTAQRYYNLARTFAAAQRWQAKVGRIRGGREPRGRHDPENRP